MTRLPFILDRVAAALAVEPTSAPEQHLAILDVARDCWDLDEQLDALIGDYANGITAIDQPDRFARLLTQRLAFEAELTRLVSQPCCAADAEDDEPAESEDDDFLSCPSERPQPDSIVHACLEVFATVGDPEAMSSADLVNCLRDLPGQAEGRWRYADLTQTRLAQLLAPYEVSTRDITLTNGRRCKSYRRSALLATLPGCSR